MPDKIQKFLNSLDKRIKLRVKERLLKLKAAPFEGNDIKKLFTKSGNFYRIRVGKIRIIYRVHNNAIEVVDIDYRGSIY